MIGSKDMGIVGAGSAGPGSGNTIVDDWRPSCEGVAEMGAGMTVE